MRSSRRPTAIITSTTGDATATAAMDITIALSDTSTDFAVADIEVRNGTKSSFAGSGKAYTVVVTAVGAGLVWVNIPADKFTDVYGVGNRASNKLVVLYTP